MRVPCERHVYDTRGCRWQALVSKSSMNVLTVAVLVHCCVAGQHAVKETVRNVLTM